jgi:dihydrofolate synthase/folylpolyglutamate synthase
MPPSDAAAARPPNSDLVLERLRRLHPRAIDLSLDRIARLLKRLDQPEGRLAPVVHVAGTNGKGSVIAYLRAILQTEGRRVQAYTSPHLVRFHERIALSDGLIDEAELVRLLETAEAANGGAAITEFEITTVAALLAFAADPADVLLLETGLGGRLDATNLIARPRLSVITPVSMDHMQFLGDRLEDIAYEKAGILKPGTPAVIGPQDPRVLAVIEARAEELGAPLHRFGREWSGAPEGAGFRYEDAAGTRRYPAPSLAGIYQWSNAATAVAAAVLLDDLVTDPQAIERGLVQARWPARLQRLTEGPLAGRLPAGDWELWLDGGHNPAAGRALAESFAAWPARPLYLVFGMLNSKDPTAFLAPLAKAASCLEAIAIPGEENILSAEAAAAAAGSVGLAAQARPSLAAALTAVTAAHPPGRILICGSLYLAGQVLAENG